MTKQEALNIAVEALKYRENEILDYSLEDEDPEKHKTTYEVLSAWRPGEVL